MDGDVVIGSAALNNDLTGITGAKIMFGPNARA
jgi:hypothetical protein